MCMNAYRCSSWCNRTVDLSGLFERLQNTEKNLQEVFRRHVTKATDFGDKGLNSTLGETKH